jgi:phosphoribosylanthranilate isomerase
VTPDLKAGSVQIYSRRASLDELQMLVEVGTDIVAWALHPERPGEVDVTRQGVQLVRSAGRQSTLLVHSKDPQVLIGAADLYRPDFLLLSSVRDDAWVPTLAKALPLDVGLMIPVPVAPASVSTTIDSSSLAREYASHATALTLDTYWGNPQVVGVTGATHDWSVSRAIVRDVPIPIVLCGGLSPYNVADAIRTVMPTAVDACSSLDYPDTKKKDPEICSAFVRAAKEAYSDVTF